MHFLTYLRNFGQNVEMFYGPFLLRNPDRNILVDTGCEARSYATGPMPPVEDVSSLQENLSKFSLSIKDIDAVIITHLHFDHAAFINLFNHCPIFLQKRELKAAIRPHPYFSGLYVSDFFKEARFELIDGDMELLPGVEVILVPGHSRGSQAVIFETNEGKAAVSGFCCIAENFNKNDPAIPGIHEDVEQAYESMRKLMGLADIIYPNHSAAPVLISSHFQQK